MANMYQDGSGALEYEGGQPKLSQIAMGLLNLIQTYPGVTGFYRQDSQSIDNGDIQEAIMAAVLPDYSERGSQLDAADFLELLSQKGVALGKSYRELILMDYAAPFDVVLAISGDPDSNLRATSYEEAIYCDKPRAGEFGGYGAYFSNRVGMHCSTAQAIQSAESLDRALSGQGEDTAESILARSVNELFGRILDPSLRELLASKLLIGEALDSVNDSVCNDRDLVDEELI